MYRLNTENYRVNNITMNLQSYFELLLPKTPLGNLRDVYLAWSGAGFVCFFVADALDHLEAASYAAYYTGSVNAAISPQFWMLLGVTGFLLLCLTLPTVYLSRRWPQLQGLGIGLRRTGQRFFRVAFAVGALIIGLLLANALHANDRAVLLAATTGLFGGVNLLSFVALLAVNTLFWLLGEALYDEASAGCSGIVRLILEAPVKYSLPAYAITAAAVLYFIASRQ